MIEAVIFDMDGLLIDSEPLWQRARIDAVGGPEILRWTDADQKSVQGGSTRNWAEILCAKLDYTVTLDEVIDRVLTHMETYYGEGVPLLPGAREAVEGLRGHVRLALASGSPYRLIRAVLHAAGWDGVFEEIMSTDDLAHGKPHPEIYQLVAARIGLPPERTAVVEDSGNGILAGHAAGAKVIAVPSAYSMPPDDVLRKADLVLRSLYELTPEAIARL